MKAIYFSFLVLLIGSVAFPQTSIPIVSDCKEADYVRGAHENIIEIDNSNMLYTPKCLIVLAGSSVTIRATRLHPFLGQAPVLNIPNPISAQNPVITDTAIVFQTPGFYGYYCKYHGSENGDGMAGTIWVQ